MNMKSVRPLSLAIAIACASVSWAPANAAATLTQSQESVFVAPGFAATAYQARLSGPSGLLLERTYLTEERIAFSSASWPDGDYRVEIWPILAVERDAGNLPAGARAPWSPEEARFTARDGVLYLADEVTASASEFDSAQKDRLIPDDLIVRGSTCVGLDCVANETFGFDTLRLKENNTRLKFDDTSVESGFADNDWELLANDAGSAGANKFSLRDVTGNTTPFTVLAGAPNNALFVDDAGDVGLGTSTPATRLHVQGGVGSTAVRLSDSSGTLGSVGSASGLITSRPDDALAVRAENGLFLSGQGNATDVAIVGGEVGIGTASPSAKLTVNGDATFSGGIDGTAIGANTPSTGEFTTLSATAIDGTPIGATTPSTGEFTTLSASGIDGTPIGATTPSTGEFTTLSATGIDGTPIGATTPSTGEFTTLTVGSLEFDAIDDTPIGATTPSTGEFTTLSATGIDGTPIGANTPSTGEFTTLSATSIDGTPIGATTPSTGEFTTLTVDSLDIDAIDATPIGATTPSTGAFTTLSSSGAANFASLNSTPIGATTPSTGAFTTLSSSGAANFASINSTPIGATTPSTGAFTTLTATGINNTPIGATTRSTGAFTTLSSNGAASFASVDSTPIGATTPSTGAFTSLIAGKSGTAGVIGLKRSSDGVTSSQILLSGSQLQIKNGATSETIRLYTHNGTSEVLSGEFTLTGLNGTPIGATTPSTGAFTSLSATGINSTPIGATTRSTGAFTTLSSNGAASFASVDNTPIGATTPSTGAFTTLTTTNGATLTKNGGTLNLIGSDHAYVQFYPDGASTRKAYFGFPSGSNDNVVLANEITSAHIVLLPTSGGTIVLGATGPSGAGTGSDKVAIAGSIGTSGNQFNVNPSVNYEMVHRSTGGWDFYTDTASKLPVRIARLAPNNQLIVEQTGVGIGTASPSEKLEVNGNIKGSGNITITGTLSQGSDRNSKENFEPVDPQMVLDKLEGMDVTRWNYKADGDDVQHIGPMAQDFYAAFGLGESETKIAPVDTSGIALLAIKGLQQDLDDVRDALAQRDAEIAAMKDALQRRDAEFAVLAEKLERLSGAVASLQDDAAIGVTVSNDAEQAAPTTQGL